MRTALLYIIKKSKNALLKCALLAAVWLSMGVEGKVFGQTEWIWVGPDDDIIDWNDPDFHLNWVDLFNPSVNGVPSNIDRVIFTDDPSIAITNLTLYNIPLTSLEGFELQAGNLKLEFDNDINIYGTDTSFRIFAHAKLTIQGPSDFYVIIGEGSRASIDGTLEILGGNGAIGAIHGIKPEDGSFDAFICFNSMAKCIVGSSNSSPDRLKAYPFSDAELIDLFTTYVFFRNGSELVFNDGYDPFGIFNDGFSMKPEMLKFETGSWFNYSSDWPDIYPPIYGNTFANFRFSAPIDRVLDEDFGSPSTAGKGHFVMDSLVIVSHVLSFEHTGIANGTINGSIIVPDNTDSSVQYLHFMPIIFSATFGYGGQMEITLGGSGKRRIIGNSTIHLNGSARLRIIDDAEVDVYSYFLIDTESSSGYGVFRLIGSSKIYFFDESFIHGTGSFVMGSGTIGIGSEHGINKVPSNLGNIRTAIRTFEPSVSRSYAYIGSTNQNPGNLLPTTTGVSNSITNIISLIIDKINVNTQLNLPIDSSFRMHNLVINRGTLAVNSSNLEIRAPGGKGVFSVENNGNIVIVDETITFTGGVDVIIAKPVEFHNLILFSGLNNGVNFGSVGAPHPIINNRLIINNSATVTSDRGPRYAPNSSLIYELNNANRTLGNEWNHSFDQNTERGVPHHVLVRGNVSGATNHFILHLSGEDSRQCLGDFTTEKIGTGSGLFTYTLGNITGGGNISQLRVGGNFNIINTNFVHNTKQVTFNGVGNTQLIHNSAGFQDFFIVRIDNDGGQVVLNNTNLRITNPLPNNAIASLNLVRGDLDLHGNQLQFLSSASGSRAINVQNGTRRIFSSVGEGTVDLQFLTQVNNSGANGRLLFDDDVVVALNGSGNVINFGFDGTNFLSTVNNILRRNSGQVQVNAPFYGPASFLQYNTGVSSSFVGSEWSTNSDPAAPGVPMHVQVGVTGVNNSQLDFNIGGTRMCRGDMIIGDAGGSGYAFTMSNGGAELNVMGNWRLRSGSNFNNGSRPVVFSGPGNSILENAGTGTFHTLSIEKDDVDATVTLANAINIDSNLNLNSGRVITTSTTILNVTNTSLDAISVLTPGESYIEGPLQRSTNTISGNVDRYVFPVGRQVGGVNYYEPLYLRDVSEDNSAFRITSHRGTPPGVPGFFDGVISGISENQYWEVSRLQPTTQAKLVYGYTWPTTFVDINGDLIPPSPTDNVAFVQLNASNNWFFPGTLPVFIDELGDATEPETRFHQNNGSLRSQTIETYPTNFFTLGIAFNKVLDVLPITLLSFNAALQNKDAVLQWVIESDVDVKNFEVEYSTNGERFNRIGIVAKNGTHYNYTHANLPAGVHYYRLKIIAKDGVQTYSKVEMLQLGTNQTIVHGLLQNPVMGGNALVKVYSAANQLAEATIVDMGGRIMLKQNVPLMQGANQANIPITLLRKGMYRLLIRTQDGVEKVLPMAIY